MLAGASEREIIPIPTVGAAAASGALALDVVDELLQLVFQARRLRRCLVGRSQQRAAKLVRIFAHRVLWGKGEESEGGGRSCAQGCT